MRHTQKTYTFLKKKVYNNIPGTGWAKNVVNLFLDGYVVSYMKCGRTWLTGLLNSYISHSLKNEIIEQPVCLDSPPYLQTIGTSLPNITLTHDTAGSIKIPADKLLSSFAPNRYIRKNTLLLTRHPSDVIVSLFYHQRKAKSHTIDENITSFIKNPQYGIQKIILYYNTWASLIRVHPHIALATYEDLYTNTEKTLKHVLTALNFPDISDKSIVFAVKENTFNRMQEREIKQRKYRNMDTRDMSVLRVREGGFGKSHKALDTQTQKYIAEIISTQLDPFFHMYKKSSHL